MVKTSTTGLEAACLAEESWEGTRGLTVTPLVSLVVGSLGVLDQTLGDYEVRGSLEVASSLRWRIFGPLGDVLHVARTDHGLIGGIRAYQEGRKKPELVYAFERHSPGIRREVCVFPGERTWDLRVA